MRVVHQTVHVMHRGCRNVGIIEQLEPFRRGPVHKLPRQNGIDVRHRRSARAQIGKARIVLVFAMQTGQRKKITPVIIGVDLHGDIAIEGAVGLAQIGQRAAVTDRTVLRHKTHAAQMLDQHELAHGFKHRHFNGLTFARFFTRIQSGYHHVDGAQPDCTVSHIEGREARRAVTGLGKQRRNAGGALHQVVIGGARAIRAVLAITDQTCIDQARKLGAQLLIAQTEAFHGARPHVRDEHIGPGNQAARHLQAIGMFEIEHDTFFVAVEVHEIRTHAGMAHRAQAARAIAARRFDLDDLGAHVAQNARGIRPHHHGGEINHLDTL